jgi:branched-subunit amino acid transport protein AzlD
MKKRDRETQQKRKMRNYLLDVGLQLRYTVFIIAIAVFLTAFLGYLIYEATQESSRIVLMTASVDPGISQDLLAQFRSKDRVVLFSIFGFGVVLVLTVTGAGIWMTHKIAGPLHNIGMAFGRVRDNRLPPELGNLRKGDELQAFHASFREMYEAICARVGTDINVLAQTIAALEKLPGRTPEIETSLTALKSLYEDKTRSLEPAQKSS